MKAKENLVCLAQSIGLTAAILAVVVVLFIGVNGVWSLCSDNHYSWPKITRCKMCEKDVYAWQSYERRSWALSVDDSAMPSDSNLRISGVSMSALFHKACPGTPKDTPPIKICPVVPQEYH